MQLFKNRPLALLSASLLLGSLITLFLYRSGISPLGAAIPLLLLFVVSLFLAKGRRSLRLVPAIALCLLLASLAQVLHHGRRFSALEAVDGSKAYTVTATVTAVEEGAPSYALYTVRVSSLNGEDA
ncbi:MAG: hypothetical protein IJF73_02480, partial [Clostridia bacterium]|nr:hypothetical protein [Clostridia bacterium]